MITPSFLKKGDKIGIISTARKISYLELKPALKIIESWGLNIVFGNFLFETNNQFAGTVNQRVMDIQQMIDNNEIKAILCARGGYGTIQIIDHINFDNFKNKPKWIIGFSDVTILHSQMQKLSIESLHSSMPINFSTNTLESINSIKDILFGKRNIIKCISNKKNRIGSAEGCIVGGNLSIIYSLLGSKTDLDTSNKILFLEDIDEYLYHTERMIISLKRAKKFESIKGLIIGGMTEMNDNDISFGKGVENIITDCLKEYNFPICFDFPSGHLKDNKPIILGRNSLLDIGQNYVNLKQ